MTTTPTQSDFMELMAERGVPPERAQQLVDILWGELPRMMKFAMLAGALGFPPAMAASLARELDETRLAGEVNMLAKRVAEAEAAAKLASEQAEHAPLISELLRVHAEVWEHEQTMIKMLQGGPDFAKSPEGRKEWSKLGQTRNRLNALTKAWVDKGKPGTS